MRWFVTKALWLALSLTFAAFWVAGYFARIEKYISTDRFCLVLSVETGSLRVRYDGGPDVLGLKTARSFKLAGSRLETVVAGWQRIDAILPLCMPAVLLASLGAGLLIMHGRQTRRRRRLGLCLHCGYDLRGNTTGRCSECGGEFGRPASGAV